MTNIEDVKPYNDDGFAIKSYKVHQHCNLFAQTHKIGHRATVAGRTVKLARLQSQNREEHKYHNQGTLPTKKKQDHTSLHLHGRSSSYINWKPHKSTCLQNSRQKLLNILQGKGVQQNNVSDCLLPKMPIYLCIGPNKTNLQQLPYNEGPRSYSIHRQKRQTLHLNIQSNPFQTRQPNADQKNLLKRLSRRKSFHNLLKENFKQRNLFKENLFKQQNKQNVERDCVPQQIKMENQDNKDSNGLSKFNCSATKSMSSDIKEKLPKINKAKIRLSIEATAFHSLQNLITHFNGLILGNKGSKVAPSRKFNLKTGNNHDLIKRLLVKRGWKQTQKPQEANFIWSQKRQQVFYQNKASAELTFTPLEFKSMSYSIRVAKDNQQFFQHPFIKLFTAEQREEIISGLSFCKNNNSPFLKFSFNYKHSDKEFAAYNTHEKFSMHNHFLYNSEIAHKNRLFHNLSTHYQQQCKNPYEIIPVTFHISEEIYRLQNQPWNEFVRYYEQNHENSMWIIKPGENSNRGTGIRIFDALLDIKSYIHENQLNSQEHTATFIIQQYVRPLLYNNRKFDIRCYLMITCCRNVVRAYWYDEGYIRTASKPFSYDYPFNRFVHLTNDAVQAQSEDYGKYEPFNKLSYADLQKYTLKNSSGRVSFLKDIVPQMKKQAKDVFDSAYDRLHDPSIEGCFQIFGLDFMIDESHHVWLIEANRNPCLQTNCYFLTRIIRNLIDNSLAIALDPYFLSDAQKGYDWTNNRYECLCAKSVNSVKIEQGGGTHTNLSISQGWQ